MPEHTEESLQHLSAAALTTFFRIASLWQLSQEEQLFFLGISSLSTLKEWNESADSVTLDNETIYRLSHIIRIYKNLQILLQDNGTADRWIKQPNEAPLFGGRSALEFMLSNGRESVVAVRKYLDLEVALCSMGGP